MLRRPISIHQTSGTKLALLFEVPGKGTEWLSQRQVGDKLDLLGPLGNGYRIYPESRNLLLAAGGIGIAPLYFLAQQALNQGCSITLLYGAKNESHLYPERLLPRKIKIIRATDDGTAGRKGRITGFLPEFAHLAHQVFACGPIGMYRDMSAHKQKLFGEKSVQVSLEMRMACGHGVCYGCTIKTKNGLRQVCQDGPVFDLDDILIDEVIC